MTRFVFLLTALLSPLYAQQNVHYLHGKRPHSAQEVSGAQPSSYTALIAGTGVDHASAVATDSNGNIYVTGWTSSKDFPITPGAFQPIDSDQRPTTTDAFVAKFDSNGTLIYCTYLGGAQDDKANAIAVDQNGSAYIIGLTTSLDFPTTKGAIMSSIADDESTGVFVAKLSPAGDSLIYSTLLGDGYYHGGAGASITVDIQGNAVITGTDYSDQFATTAGAATPNTPAGNFVAKLNATGTAFLFVTSTTFPSDFAAAVTLDSSGNVYVAGRTYDLTNRGPNVVQPANAAQTFHRTNDSGAHWSLPGPGIESMAVTSVAIDPQNGSVIYASGATGLFKSVDGGDSWASTFAGEPAGKAIVDPSDSKHLVLFALDGGYNPTEYVSRDGGDTWTRKGPISGFGSDLIRDIVFDPSRPQNAYAAGNGHIFYSRDGGDSWRQSQIFIPVGLSNPQRWISPIVDPTNPDILYVSALSGGPSLFRSTDAGVNWTYRSGSYFTNLVADPHAAGVLYGVSPGLPLQVSLDGGATWNSRLPGLYFDNIALDPVIHSLYLFGMQTGLYRSTDGGLTADNITAALPVNNSVFALYFDPNTSGKWIALSQFWSDAFVTKLSADGTTTLFSTYLGGSGADGATDIALDSVGSILVAGATDSADFIGAADSLGRSSKAFVAKLSNDGSQLSSAPTVVKGQGFVGPRMALDAAGNVFLVGATYSVGFPLSPDALQQTLPPPDQDGFVSVGYYVKLSPGGDLVSASYIGGTQIYSTANAIAIAPSGRVCIVGDLSAFALGTFTPSPQKPTHAFLTWVDFQQ